MSLSRAIAAKYTRMEEILMRTTKMPVAAVPASALLLAAACSGGNDARPGDSALSPVAEDKPAIMRAVDGIPGWIRNGDVETYTKDGLYGYIDGGAEIVFPSRFRAPRGVQLQ